jgi:uncharacterized protein (UPF0297 family)
MRRLKTYNQLRDCVGETLEKVPAYLAEFGENRFTLARLDATRIDAPPANMV